MVVDRIRVHLQLKVVNQMPDRKTLEGGIKRSTHKFRDGDLARACVLNNESHLT